jgi:hypothetical protein
MGSKTPFWLDEPELWDEISIAQHALSCLADVKGKKGRKVETKTSPGKDGASTTHLGYEPGTAEVKLTMWLPEHLVEWEALLPTLLPHKGEPGAPVAVIHPQLAMLGMRSLTLMSIEGPVPGSELDTMEVSLSFQEFTPETTRNNVTKKAVTPKHAPPPAAKKVTPKPKPQVAIAKRPSTTPPKARGPVGEIDLSQPPS